MKALFGITLALFAGLLLYWFMAVPRDGGPALTLPIAWGNPAAGQVEMNAVIGVVLAQKSRQGEKGGLTKPMNWDEWIDKHCVIRGPSGETTKVRRQANSLLIPHRDVQEMVGTEEFFLAARLKPGTSYTFDYIIENPNPETYRCQLVAPAQPEKTRVYRLELVKP